MSGITGADRGQVGLILTISVLFGTFMAWAYLTELDLVTRGQGRVVALGQNRPVQATSAGTVLAYNVEVGDLVEAGDVIASVNPIEARAQLTETEAKLHTLTARLARLDRELSGDALVSDDVPPAATNQLVIAEYELLKSRKADLVARVEALVQARLQRERELEGVLAEIEGVRRSVQLLHGEATQILPLVESGALGATERFRIDREQAELDTRMAVLRERKGEIEAAISEKTAEIDAARTGYRNAVLEERAEVLGQLAEINERLPALRLKVRETDIFAPIRGIVNQVFYNTPGAVVADGEVVAELVPVGEALHVEANVLPEDIANVEPGQAARISLTAYDAAKYGTLSGEVLRVSADATFNDETQMRMFVVDVSIFGEIVDADGAAVKILPGMVAQVDIVRGSRTVLEYIWNPVTKVRDRAFRE